MTIGPDADGHTQSGGAVITVLHARTAANTATIHTCILGIAPFPWTRGVWKPFRGGAEAPRKGGQQHGVQNIQYST